MNKSFKRLLLAVCLTIVGLLLLGVLGWLHEMYFVFHAYSFYIIFSGIFAITVAIMASYNFVNERFIELEKKS